jgi:hypothetical protein
MTSNATCATGSPATSNSVTMIVNPSLPVSISILASTDTICFGTSVTFTATPTNGGTTPTYQWTVNGVNVGTDSPTYTDTALTNNDVVSCILTSNEACTTGNPASSNSVTMTVDSILPVSIIVSADNNPVCAGSLVTFTASPTNGGTIPSYQWTVNGNNIGTDSPTYSDGALINSDVISCILTSNASCSSGSPANSNSVNMIVNSIPIAPVITQIFDTLFSSVVNGNQWYLGSTGNPIVGATSQYYITTTNDDYYVIVTDSNGCVSDTSNIFNVFTVSINNLNTEFNINIYPNPNNGSFNIQLNNPLNEKVTIELFDAIGQLVYKSNLTNTNKHDFNLREVSGGLYTIKITTSHNSLTRKLIIQK